MSNKRVRDEDDWYNPVPSNRLPMSTPTNIAADAAASIMDMWFFQENRAYEKKHAEMQAELDELRPYKRRHRRLSTLYTMSVDRADGLHAENQWLRGMIDDIFTRFPEVGHEYEWLQTREVLDESETESEDNLAMLMRMQDDLM